MKNNIIRLVAICVMSLARATLSAQNADNVAYQDNQVRFTVVTDGVIRLEWEPDGKFTDLPSFVASERESQGNIPHPRRP